MGQGNAIKIGRCGHCKNTDIVAEIEIDSQIKQLCHQCLMRTVRRIEHKSRELSDKVGGVQPKLERDTVTSKLNLINL